MVDGAGGSDEFFGPGDRLVILDQITEPSRICGDRGGVIEVAVVGSPPDRGAQIGQLDGEPPVGVSLSGFALTIVVGPTIPVAITYVD